MYSAGRITGLAFDSGEGLTQVYPVYEGFSFPYAQIRTNLAGGSCTDWLSMTLDMSTSSSIERQTIIDIKEKECYVSTDYEAEITKYKEFDNKPFQLPDGNFVTIEKQRIMCPELLFKPGFLHMQAPGIHELIFNSIMKCDIDVRKDM